MASIKLEIVDVHKGLIRAPAHCPFKRTVLLESYPNIPPDDCGDVMAVNASVCRLCKLCTFLLPTPVSVGAPAGEVTMGLEDAKRLVQRAILADQQILASIMKQIRYLQTKDRSALVVLMSYGALQMVVLKSGYENGEFALNRVVMMDGPICTVSGVPLYFSQLLTRSPVQVVGEVEWL